MLKSLFTSVIFIVSFSFTFSQEVPYFNNVYNPENTYASGRGIIQQGNYYYGIAGTENSSYYYRIGLFKMNINGELLIWKTIGENGSDYFAGSVGGTLIGTNDGNFAFCCHIQAPDKVFGSLIKLDINLDTIWKKNYTTENLWTMTMKCNTTSDNGFLLVGSVKPAEGAYWNDLLIKTDSTGNMEWYKTYGGNLSEHGQNVIETPDGGYLIGGYIWNPPEDHSLDAMVIKTDSLGNEQWTKYFGNPWVDDDMAFVAMADDGNYLVATVYGEWNYSSTYRVGRPWVFKLDAQGQILEQKKIGEYRLDNFIKNFRKTDDGYILTGFSYETDTTSMALYTGWGMKIDINFDSVWYHDYSYYNNLYDDNFLYDISPTTDNGYIAAGYARPDGGGQTNKMWIVKVDSMGCDTPGCATGVFVEDLSPFGGGKGEELKLYPNPAKDHIVVKLNKTNISGATLSVFDNRGVIVRTVTMPAQSQDYVLGLKDIKPGIYILKVGMDGNTIGSKKFSVIN